MPSGVPGTESVLDKQWLTSAKPEFGNEAVGKAEAYWLDPICGPRKMVIPSPASLHGSMGPWSGNEPRVCGIGSRERQCFGLKGVTHRGAVGKGTQHACGWQSSQGPWGVLPACPGEGQERARMAFHGKEGEKERGNSTPCHLHPKPLFCDGEIEYLTGEVLEVSDLKAMELKVRGKRLALG